MVRAAALLATLAALAAYFAVSEHLPEVGVWGDVAFLSLVLMPGFLLLAGIALPLSARPPGRLGIGVLALAVLTAGLTVVGLDAAANFTKFAAVVGAGWWFLGYFEAVSWVLLVAVLIVPVDIYSVARGPTKVIVEQQPQIFDALSISFPILGEHNSAQLGLPDVLFFALFLGATVRFALRPLPTWIAMALSFGGTISLAVGLGVAGLPALPLLSVGFVLPNADLLWRQVRAARR